MKHTRITYSVALALVLLSITACQKFLKQPVLGFNTPDVFFTSDANAVLAVNAAYVPLNFSSSIANPIWVLGDIASDDAIKGDNAGDQADFDAINRFSILPTNSAVEGVWSRYYDGVLKCNVVLDGLVNNTNKGITADTLKSCIAQAKFLRAYYYFILTCCYGGIPLRLTVQAPADLQTPCTKHDSILKQVEQDCIDAAANLPATANLGRATQGAALALLAKAYVFAAQYQPAVDAITQLENLGVYSLDTLYSNNFSALHKNTKEAVFTVNHAYNTGYPIGNELNTAFAPRSLQGWGFLLPTQSLIDNFEAGDPRQQYTVCGSGMYYYDSIFFDPTWSSTGYVSIKHTQSTTAVPLILRSNGSLNYQAIRYAEVLLLKAEALNELGQTAAALVPLNVVRARARNAYMYDTKLTGYPTVPAGLLPDVTTTDQVQVRDAIRRERRSELALEFHRFFDIIRYGATYANAALSSVNGSATSFNYTTNQYFPIPQSERNTNKKWDQTIGQ